VNASGRVSDFPHPRPLFGERGGVPRAVAVSILCALGCASSSAEYTPQIKVVPGAAARSLWILSKSADAGDDAEVLVLPHSDADADVPPRK